LKYTHLSIVISFALFSLVGCATKSIPNNFSFNNQRNEGVVVFSVSHDSLGPQGTKAIFYLDHNKGIDNPLFYSTDETILGIIKDSEFPDSHGHLIVLAIPSGQHAIDYWQITNGTGLRILPKENPVPLTFEVTAGDIIYIGNLHAALHIAKNIFGITITANGFPVIKDQSQRDIAVFESKYPQFKGKTNVKLLPTGPWLQSLETIKKIETPPLQQ
jgi:hypothetical protein